LPERRFAKVVRGFGYHTQREFIEDRNIAYDRDCDLPVIPYRTCYSHCVCTSSAFTKLRSGRNSKWTDASCYSICWASLLSRYDRRSDRCGRFYRSSTRGDAAAEPAPGFFIRLRRCRGKQRSLTPRLSFESRRLAERF